ncbi:MAG: DUF6165 family protein [Chitinispirillaceae bacterium]|nr:DUF6165 family protein [Chitinispirillaceae bacterium]
MLVEVSIGDVVDKATILAIKSERVTDPVKLGNIRTELALLTRSLSDVGVSLDSDDALKLRALNEAIWDIEDRIRAQEVAGQFGAEFIRLARAVYFTNDERAEVKKRINLSSGSKLVEEKQYVDYKKTNS